MSLTSIRILLCCFTTDPGVNIAHWMQRHCPSVSTGLPLNWRDLTAKVEVVFVFYPLIPVYCVWQRNVTVISTSILQYQTTAVDTEHTDFWQCPYISNISNIYRTFSTVASPLFQKQHISFFNWNLWSWKITTNIMDTRTQFTWQQQQTNKQSLHSNDKI